MVVPITMPVINWQPQPQSSTFQNGKQMNWLHNGLRLDSGAWAGAYIGLVTAMPTPEQRCGDTNSWHTLVGLFAVIFYIWRSEMCVHDMSYFVYMVWNYWIRVFSMALPPWYLLRKSTYIIGSNFKSGFDSSKNLHDSCQQMRGQMVLYVYKYANMKDNISTPISYCWFLYRKEFYSPYPNIGGRKISGQEILSRYFFDNDNVRTVKAKEKMWF